MLRKCVALLVPVVTLIATASVVLPASSAADAAPLGPTATSAPSTPGGFVPTTSTRILDTRSGLGATAPGAHGVATVAVLGHAPLPASGVSAVLLNVTATSPTAAGSLTVYPDGATRPSALNVVFAKGATASNAVVVPVAANGKIAFYNGSVGRTQIIAHVTGYYLAGSPAAPGSFVSTASTRVLDTRSQLGATAPKAHGTAVMTMTGRGPVPQDGVAAVVLNVTVTAPTASGYLSVYAQGAPRPSSPNLYFAQGSTVPRLVVAPLSYGGRVDFYNGSTGTTQVIAHVVGYLLAGGPDLSGTVALTTPTRILDTRTGLGAATPAARGTARAVALGREIVPSAGVSALLLTVTARGATAPGYLTAYPDGAARPSSQNVVFAKGRTTPNLVIVPIGSDGELDFYNGSAGTTDITADVIGYVRSCGPECLSPAFTPSRTPGSPQQSGAYEARPEAVDCPAAGSCVAVDNFSGADSDEIIAQELVNGTWTSATIPMPEDAEPGSGRVSGVSCPTTTVCVAVGQYQPATGTSATRPVFVATRTDGQWRSQAIPLPAGGSNLQRISIACASSARCAVVGTYTDADDHNQSFLSSTGPDGWTTSRVPLPETVTIDPRVLVTSVSCVEAACYAVGSYVNDLHRTSGVIVTADDAGLSSQAAVQPAGTDGAYQTLTDVDCVQPAGCSAVGAVKVGQRSRGVVQSLASGTWTPRLVPTLPGEVAGAPLNLVSCATATACTAMGTYDDVRGTRLEAVRIGSGTMTVEQTPLPPDASRQVEPAELDCASQTTCVAVGAYHLAGGSEKGMIATFADGQWTAATAALPVDSGVTSTSRLRDVACSSPTTCAAVGYYTVPNGMTQGLLEAS